MYNSTQSKIKVKPISRQGLARKIASLDDHDDALDFWSGQDENGYGIEIYSAKYICEFDAWMIVINVWGGGSATIIDFTPCCEEDLEINRLTKCIHDYCKYIGSHSLYINDDSD